MNPSNPFGPIEPALPNVPPPLPPVQADGAAVSSAGAATPVTSEAAPVPGATPSGGAAVSWLPPTVPVQSGAGNANDQASSGLSVSVPAIADDGDIIEKEWVEKAKQIVAQNRQDPYKQARELHRFKAEYLLKRYNKKIEAVED